MKRVLFGISLLIALTNGLSAQNMLNNMMENFRFKKMTESTYTRDNLKVSDIQGTPYLSEKFSPGKITTKEGVTYKNIPLRYNGFSDDLEFQKGEDCYNIDPKSTIKRAEFGGRVFSCMEYSLGGKIRNGYFELLTEGNATLLVKYTVKLVEKAEASAYVDAKPARFDAPSKEYYLIFKDASAKLITNKKSLLELFGNQKDEMESYISKNKLSVKEDDTLKKIVSHYNSL